MLTSRLISRHLRPIQPFTPIFSVLEKEFGYAGSRNGVNRRFGRGRGREREEAAPRTEKQWKITTLKPKRQTLGLLFSTLILGLGARD